MSYEEEKYFCTKETLKETLNTYGVAIVPGVLNENETNSMVSGIWDYFEHLTQNWEKPINRNDKNTWNEIYKLYPLHSMMFQYFSIGQTQASWDVRQNEKIVDIFSTFWNCKNEDLLVSFDGLSFNMPPEVTNRGWNRNNTWYHTDQSYLNPEFNCMQTWVTGLDVEENDATLGFYEGSHKYHKEFCKEFDVKEKNDWYKLKNEEELFYINRCEQKKIMCPKGSLVCWDSRTIHCGVEADKKRKNEKFRAIVYLCYKPRKFATEARIRKKQKAFNELRSTTHWPCKVKLFGKKPRTWGGELPEITQISPPRLTDLGKRLAGF